MNEDTLFETPEVKEALRRLPKQVAEERQYRITRALYLSMRKEILPKEEWTSYDSVRYLLFDDCTKKTCKILKVTCCDHPGLFACCIFIMRRTMQRICIMWYGPVSNCRKLEVLSKWPSGSSCF